MPGSFLLLLAAQFASALADNALLIVTIDLLQQRAMPGWLAPMLKVAFIAAYVVLAPFVGPLADAFPKARLMAWMNGREDLRRGRADRGLAARRGLTRGRTRRGRLCARQVRPGHRARAA